MTGRRRFLRRLLRRNFWQAFVCQKFFLFVVVLFSQAPQFAQSAPLIETLRRMNFGVLAVKSNAAPTSVVLSPLGSASYGSGLVYVGAPASGRYRLSGYPAFTDITVSLSAPPVGLASGLPGEKLALSAAVAQPTVLHTDVNGQVVFDLGATLTTSGTSQPYPDGIYLGSPTLTLSFDVAGTPQVSYQDIAVDLELRTSLALAELQAIDFGRLAATSSATHQATMTMDPNGNANIVNAGTARLLRFGGERPAIFRVTTGAAYAPVNITLPGGIVYLTHQSLSADVARLEVSNFVSLPASGDAKLNASGELEFRLGATVKTEQTAKPFQDGIYSGTFPLTVEYQ